MTTEVYRKKYYQEHKARIAANFKEYYETHKYEHLINATYHHMQRRCYNPKHKQFQDYGGRGITVCERWRGKGGRKNFIEDMGVRPEGYTLERKDNDAGYSPDNCIWANRYDQQRNRRNTIFVEFEGEKIPLVEAAARSGIRYTTLRFRIRKGCPIERLFRQTPKMRQKEILEQEVLPNFQQEEVPNWDQSHHQHQTHTKFRMPKLNQILQRLGLMRS